jgi:Na+-translocating ferredoxin:NAD+ oxidoreductase subunit D
MSEDNNQEVKMPNPAELMVSSSPHLHDKDRIDKIMYCVILALLPSCIAGVYFFGVHALKILVLCSVFCVGIEIIWCKVAGRVSTWKDGSALLTGILLGMNLSSWMPWWICLVGVLLAIGLGKQLYGGLGYNPFNPALVARVGLLIGFPKLMTTWGPTKMMVADATTAATTCATPLDLVKTASKTLPKEQAVKELAELSSNQALWDYAIGNVGGCIGEVSAIALIIGGVFLIFMKIIKWQVPVAYIGTVALMSGIIHMISPHTTPAPIFHIVTGGLMIGAFFMATDMVTSPMTNKGALVFGIGCGVITCAIRIWGGYPEGVSFSILIMNALTPLIDRFTINRPFGYEPPVKEGGAA